MSPNRIRYIVIIAVVALVFLSTSLFVVDETEQVVITQLGKPVGDPIKEAGLHFKLPFVQRANFFEKRIMKWDGSPNQIPTKDKKYIWVDTTARWRIKEPLLFMKRVGLVSTAMSRLDGIIDSVVRDYVSSNMLVELVRSEGWDEHRPELLDTELPEVLLLGEGLEDEESTPLTKGRQKITREMLAKASELVPEFGIELLDLRIKRINYIDRVQQKVFDRMISERKRIAAQYRSEGEGEKAAILGQMERELSKIQSEAYRESQEIRGKADAEATKIYADAFGGAPEFYEFYRTLEYYKVFNNPQSLFLMTSDADIFKYLKASGAGGEN